MTSIPERKPMFDRGCAFVAGGSGGVGSAICRSLAESGSDVVLTYRNNPERADAARLEAMRYGAAVESVQLDLEDYAATHAALEAAVAAHGAIHTVVYAAGPFVPLKFMSSVTPEEFSGFLRSDTVAFFNLIHAALPHLRRTAGSIVAITTTVTARWSPQDGLSAIPKAAIERLVAGIAREEGRFGIRSNCVALGLIDAGMFKRHIDDGRIDENYMKAAQLNVPLRRMGTAQEAADAVVYLASSRASFTTGITLRVDGGFAS